MHKEMYKGSKTSGSPSSSKLSKSRRGGFSYPIALFLLACGLTFIAVSIQQVMSGSIQIHGTTKVIDLQTYTDKLELVAKYASLQVFCLLITNMNVGFSRAIHRAENPLVGREDRITVQKNFLQNTLEQVVLSLVTQISLIAFLSAEQTLKVIPLMNFLWIFGRFFFFLGYPNYRSFGFSITFFPTFLAAIFTLYKFFEVQYGLELNMPLDWLNVYLID